MRKRLVLLTYPSAIAMTLLSACNGHPELCIEGIVLSKRGYKARGRVGSLIAFGRNCGWRYAVYTFATTLLCWWLGRVRDVARRRVSTHTTADINSTRSIAWVLGKKPDVVVVCYFNQKLGPSFLDGVRAPTINIHPALLPKHRGPDPCFQVLSRREGSSGLTVHHVAPELDSGNMLYQEAHRVDAATSLLAFSQQEWQRGIEGGLEWLRKEALMGGGVPQDETRASYETWPSAHDVEAFRRQGGRLGSTAEWWRTLRRAIEGTGAAGSRPGIGTDL